MTKPYHITRNGSRQKYAPPPSSYDTLNREPIVHSIVSDVFKCLSYYVFNNKLEVTQIQKRLLGVKDNAPSDKMTDLQSLSVYLKEQDEKDYKAALGCQDMSLNSSSFWSYGRPSLDLSHVFRNNQFQLASQSQQSHKSWTNDSDYLGEEVWRTLGVTDDLFLWIERLRKSWEVMGVSASSCGIEVVVGASMGNHGANICPQILSLTGGESNSMGSTVDTYKDW
ncbi:TM209-like protein [Mya arenaria]|uniref:TM209-like protein n=1 Tax=Mya arenaria TaxID=6604 RepID=A0ABY7DGG5_MYAAR|nr:TM209-like protein [Mya arenaria]